MESSSSEKPPEGPTWKMFEPWPAASGDRSLTDCDCDECAVGFRGKRKRHAREEPPTAEIVRTWRQELSPQDAAERIVAALRRWPEIDGGSVRFDRVGAWTQLSEMAVSDGSSVWKAGVVGPCVQVLREPRDLTVAAKACAVLQHTASEAAAEFVARGVVGAVASWLLRDHAEPSTALELRRPAAFALHALCAAPGPAGSDALAQLLALEADLDRSLRALEAEAREDARGEPLLERLAWLRARLRTRVAAPPPRGRTAGAPAPAGGRGGGSNAVGPPAHSSKRPC